MSKFNDVYNNVMFNDLNSLPDTNTILPINLCNINNCYKWVKGQANVYGCLITDENVGKATKFLHKGNREDPDCVAQVGKYLIYNPNIPKDGGQVWISKLAGYIKADKSNTAFNSLTISKDGLDFEEYIFIPKDKDLEEGVDYWYGFQIPANVEEFKIPEDCGNSTAGGSSVFGTDWLPIVNKKFDYGRSLKSMKQSNFTCEGKVGPVEIDQKCLDSWNNKK